MIDLLTLNCGCQWDNGSWDVCLFHRYKDGAMDKDGPIPLSGLDDEPQNPAPQPWPFPWSGIDEKTDKIGQEWLDQRLGNIRSIFDAASGRVEPYEDSTRQAKAERYARKFRTPDPASKTANHCPTCTCKKDA